MPERCSLMARLSERALPASPPQPHLVSLLVWGLVPGVLLWSSVSPHDRLTWWLEVLPVLVGLPLLAWCHRHFPLTPLVQAAIALHMLVLLYGGHYTYALTPAGDWLQSWLGRSRNPFDRIGHLMQGAVPALVAREILLRRTPLTPGGWLTFLVISVCLAISAGYELIEFAAARLLGQGADQFLAMQGDVWDTQWDMLCALIGASVSLLLFSRWHDRQLA